VSWRCSTYGRPDYLPHIVNDFLNQDYKGESEIVILNDDPDVKYVCNHKKVKIYNHDHRYDNLRRKQNVCMSLCTGELIQAVADDDRYKPWAISRFVEEIKDYPFMACHGYLKTHKNGIRFHNSTIAGLYMVRKDYFEKMGGYKEWTYKLGNEKTGYVWAVHPEDFMERVRMKGDFRKFLVNKDDVFFLWYREANRDIWDMSDKQKFLLKRRSVKTINIPT